MGNLRIVSFFRTVFLLSILLPALFCVTKVEAFELYRLLDGGCSTSPGLIIHADEVSIKLLTLDGDLQTVNRSSVTNILVYNIHNNPISFLKLSGNIGGYLRQVQSISDESSSFIAWPIRFIEDLIVFYDIEGKTHLIEINKLKSFSIPDQKSFSDKKIKNSESYKFGIGNSLSVCPSNNELQGQWILPTRTMGDQIRINKFLSVYQEGFQHLDRFQRRTFFYAKPFLFEEKMSLALTVTNENYQEELPIGFPGSVQWSSGSPYSSQGTYSFGARTLEFLPNVEPVFAIYSAVKSHFFQASFAGNVNGFAAGSDFLIKYRSFYEDYYKKKDLKNPFVIPQFNYVAITGVGIKEYYLGAGFYYPLIGIFGNEKFREILSTKASPILQFHYTLPSLKFQLVASKTELGSSSPDKDDIILIYSEALSDLNVPSDQNSEYLLKNLDRFEYRSRFVRFGLEVNSEGDFSYGIHEIILQGEYEEKISGVPYELKYNQWITALFAEKRFGNYLALKGGVNYFKKIFHSKTMNEEKEYQKNKFSAFVVVKFIL